jgi:aminoglycoside phosphotransferase (APT) family kinase protein
MMAQTDKREHEREAGGLHADAPSIVAPVTRDLVDLSRQLATWLKGRLQAAGDVAVLNLAYPLGAGMSHETILFDAEWDEQDALVRRGMVVRIKPTQRHVYHDDMFDQQYELMRLMHAGGIVRVAKPLWMEPAPDLLGAPFFVMEKVTGRVAVSYPPYTKQGWLVEAAPCERRRLWEDSVRQLAAIQNMPVESASFLNHPIAFEQGFDQEVDRWRRYLNWVDPGASQLLLHACFDRLMALAPADRAPGIVWGDARLGNMMIGPDFKVAAVMDWEQPSLGGALHDLGWWLCSDANQTTGQGLKPLDGMGTREETIALWSEACAKSATDIEWYEAFVGFKQECLALRMTYTGMLPQTSRKPGARLASHLGVHSL